MTDMNAAEILPTITTVDQNTGRQITWNVVHVAEHADPAKAKGFTHMIGMVRPKGRRSYMIHAEMIGDVIVRHTTPLQVF